MLALERRIEAEIARGRSVEIVAEAGDLARAHPLRDRPRWLHMVALYRSGRQAEALESYRHARAHLADELGLEPGPALQELERAILRQDASLRTTGSGTREPQSAAPVRSIVVAELSAGSLEQLARLGAPLAERPPRELLLVRTVSDAGELSDVSTSLRALRQELREAGVDTRGAAFTSLVPGADLGRVATEQDADLVLVDAPDQLLEDGRLLALLGHAPCDVGVVVGSLAGPGDVLVPFVGGEHDWAAVELGAWLARAYDAQLLLAGASVGETGRDASRLLANASLAVQRALGVTAEPRARRAGAGSARARPRRGPPSSASACPTAGIATGSGRRERRSRRARTGRRSSSAAVSAPVGSRRAAPTRATPGRSRAD